MIESKAAKGVVYMFEEDQHEASVQRAIDSCVSDIATTIQGTISQQFSKKSW